MDIINFILILFFTGIAVVFCLFLCMLATISDDVWEKIKRNMKK